MTSKTITVDLSPDTSDIRIHTSSREYVASLPERLQFTVEATERGPPPSYEEAMDPSRAPPPSYESIIGRVREAHKESSGTVDFFKKLVVLLAGTIGCTIAIGVTIVVPFAMFLIGVKYLNDCPANVFIPIYLLVGGFVGVLKQFIQVVSRIRRIRARTDEEEDEPRSSLQSLLTCFMLTWFFLGSYWVYKDYMPSFNPADIIYCNKTVYLFAFWQVTIVYIAIALMTFCLCSISLFVVTFAHSHMRMHHQLEASR